MNESQRMNDFLIAGAISSLTDSQFLGWAATMLADIADESGSLMAECASARFDLIALRLEAIDALEEDDE